MSTLEGYERKLIEKCKGRGGHNFLKTLVLTYLRRGISPPPTDLHGRGEKGKDIYFCHSLPQGLGELHCVVMIHMDEIDSRIGSRNSVERVIEQARKSFDYPIDVGGYEAKSVKHVDVVIVITPKKIGEDAKAEIRNKIELGTRNILFLSGADLISIIYQYDKDKEDKDKVLKKFLGDE